jgi:hypothetical protein
MSTLGWGFGEIRAKTLNLRHTSDLSASLARIRCLVYTRTDSQWATSTYLNIGVVPADAPGVKTLTYETGGKEGYMNFTVFTDQLFSYEIVDTSGYLSLNRPNYAGADPGTLLGPKDITGTTEYLISQLTWAKEKNIDWSEAPYKNVENMGYLKFYNLKDHTQFATLYAKNIYYGKTIYSVTANTTGNGGTVTGTGNYYAGEQCYLKANPYVGKALKNWTNSSGTVLSTSLNYNFTVNSNTYVIANFVDLT